MIRPDSPDLDHRLRAADPYQPTDLAGAEVLLMEQILRESPVDPTVVAQARSLRRRRAGLRSRVALSLATAAAVGTAFTVPWLLAQPDAQGPVGSVIAAIPGDEGAVQIRYVAAAMQVAEANPRVLVTEPGWKVRSIEAFTPTAGKMVFQEGPDRDSVGSQGQVSSRVTEAPSLSVTWYPRAEHADYHASRSDVPGAKEFQLWGGSAVLLSYSPTDHAVLLEPQGDVFLELRGRNIGDQRAFLKLLDDGVEQVDVARWLSAMPPQVVTVGGAAKATEQILADIPIPPGFDRDTFGSAQALDPYQFGAKVTGAVACGWIQEWERARTAGDDDAARHASEQLATSRDWVALQEMDAEGDYPEVIWAYSDEVAAGNTPAGYREGLGCS